MSGDKFIMFRNRLEKVSRHLIKVARNQNVSCFRLFDHDLPEFPLCIEIYDKNVYVAEYERKHGFTETEHELWLKQSIEVIAEVLKTQTPSIFTKLRSKKKGRLDQYQKTGTERSEFIVEENGLDFIINLSDYLDTGLFLDHRLTRSLVKDEAKEKHILNLFAYTGSFSVYAAAGKANRVLTIDLSNTYIDWAKRNMELNGFTDADKFQFIQTDVLNYLERSNEDRFDLVVLDPPTFSNSKKMTGILDIQRDYVKLINNCISILNPGGKIIFSTNYSNFKMNPNLIDSQFVRDITKRTTPFDFTNRLKRVCFEICK